MKNYESIFWGVHIQGPDTLLAAKGFEEANQRCCEINSSIIASFEGKSRFYPIMFAQVCIWPYADGHDPSETDWSEVC